MKRDTIYKIIIGLLLVLNLFQLIGFLIKPKPGKPPMQEIKFEKKAEQMMQLNEEQKEKFSRLVSEHHKKIIKLHDFQIDLSREYFNEPSDSLLKLIAKTEIDKISTTEEHFTDIKHMLNEEQIPLFYKFKNEALKGILRYGSTSEHRPKLKNNERMPPQGNKDGKRMPPPPPK